MHAELLQTRGKKRGKGTCMQRELIICICR